MTNSMIKGLEDEVDGYLAIGFDPVVLRMLCGRAAGMKAAVELSKQQWRCQLLPWGLHQMYTASLRVSKSFESREIL